MLYIFIIIFVLFQNIILIYLPDYQLFDYWDEFAFLIIVIWFFINILKKKSRDTIKLILLLLGIIVVGIAGNIIYRYQISYNAIIRDIVGFLKFPLTLLAICQLNLIKKLSYYFYKMLPILKIVMFIIFFLGMVSLVFNVGLSQTEYRYGIHPYQFLFEHPTYLTTFAMMVLLAFNAAQECTMLDDIIILSIIILGMRTKGLIFIVIYIFMKYGGNWLKKFKFLYWGIIILLALGAAHSKLMLYASYSTSARETIYLGAISLIQMCFPIGSGFGSFGSHLSAKMSSGVYNIIHISDFYTDKGLISPVIGDAGYPYYVAQFGVIGIIFLVFIVLYLIELTHKNIDDRNKFSIDMMWIMIAVSLIAETILVNDGLEVAVMLGIIWKLCEMYQNGQLKKLKRIKFKLHKGSGI